MRTFESKQVGTLYHTTSLSSLVFYIVSRDVLKSSGMYDPNKITGRRDVIYFSRSKNIDSVKWLAGSDVIATIVIDGNKLSENYHIFSYNDFVDVENDKGRIPGFAKDPTTGMKKRIWMDRQHEECVDRPIKNVSKYIKEIIVRFNEDPGNPKPGEDRFATQSAITRDITELKKYCDKHGIRLTADDYMLQRVSGVGKYQDPLKARLIYKGDNNADKTIQAQDLVSSGPLFNEDTLNKLYELIKSGADADRIISGNEPLLIRLCKADKENDNIVSIIKCIIDSGANINILGWQNRTPIMWACLNGLVKIVKLLISAGADVNAVTKYGDTALSCTKKATIKKLLIAAGAKSESLEDRVYKLEKLLNIVT